MSAFSKNKSNGFFQVGTIVEQGQDGFDPEVAGLGWVCVEVGHKQPEVYWMRLVLPYASKEFGVALYPEIGDQVLTVRIGGGEYLCLGSLYTGKTKAKVSNDEGSKYGKNFIKELRTRNGNAIVINDEDDKEFVQIDVKDGAMTVKMDIGGKSITIDGTDKAKTFDVLATEAVMTVKAKEAHLDINGKMKLDVADDGTTTFTTSDFTISADGKNVDITAKAVTISASSVDIC